MPEISINKCKTCGQKTVVERYLPEKNVRETRCYSCAKTINNGAIKIALIDLHNEIIK
jgi:hypothetical protein